MGRLIPAFTIPPPKAFLLLPAYLLVLQLGDSVHGDAISQERGCWRGKRREHAGRDNELCFGHDELL